MKTLIILCALFALCACIESECVPNETRCNDNVVEICNGDEQWCEVMDCSEVYGADGGEWECCEYTSPYFPDEPIHTCLPIDRCEEGP